MARRHWVTFAVIGVLLGLSLASLSPGIVPVRAQTPPGNARGPAPPRALYAQCLVRSPGPGFAAYDPADQYFYATDNGVVLAINATNRTSCHVAGAIALPAGANGQGLAYDRADRSIYVAGNGLNEMFVIRGLHVVHKIANVSRPFRVTYDDQLRAIAVGTSGSNVTFIRGGSILRTVLFQNMTGAIGYSATGHDLLVAYYNASNPGVSGVELYSGTTGLTQFIALGGSSVIIQEMTFDAGNGLAYLCGGLKLFALDPAHLRWGNLTLGNGCGAPAYSPAKNAIYVADITTNNVYVVRNLSLVKTLSVRAALYGVFFSIAYSSADSSMYITTGYHQAVDVVPT